jgi:hypothetical protein
MLANSTVQELVTQGQLLQILVDNREKAIAILKNLPWIKSVKTEKIENQENEYIIIDAPKDSASRVNQVLAENNIFASELVSRNVSLESVFLQLTGGNSGD